MITNATLLRIDTPQPATTAGKVTFATGAAVAVGCVLAAPTRSLLTAAEASKVTVTAQLVVLLTALGDVTLAQGQKVVVRMEGFDAAGVPYFVRMVGRNAKAGGLSHWLLGLEAA